MFTIGNVIAAMIVLGIWAVYMTYNEDNFVNKITGRK